MNLFAQFVEREFSGNQSKAASALNCSRSLVSRLINNERAVTPAMAARIETLSKGRFRKEAFIWPESKAA